MASVRIWAKGRIRMKELTFPQRKMVALGGVAVGSVLRRVRAAQGPDDGPATPLKKRYAIWKTKKGRSNKRNLTLSGDMLRSLAVRTVTDNSAKAAVTGRGSILHAFDKQLTKRYTRDGMIIVERRKSTGWRGVSNRIKAWANQKIQPWLVFSPKNSAEVREAARRILIEMKPYMLLKSSLGGRQR